MRLQLVWLVLALLTVVGMMLVIQDGLGWLGPTIFTAWCGGAVSLKLYLDARAGAVR